MYIYIYIYIYISAFLKPIWPIWARLPDGILRMFFFAPDGPIARWMVIFCDMSWPDGPPCDGAPDGFQIQMGPMGPPDGIPMGFKKAVLLFEGINQGTPSNSCVM